MYVMRNTAHRPSTQISYVHAEYIGSGTTVQRNQQAAQITVRRPISLYRLAQYLCHETDGAAVLVGIVFF